MINQLIMKGIKHLHMELTEKEHRQLLREKGSLSWRAFVLPRLGIVVKDE